MRKATYKNTVKLLKGADALFIQLINDMVYISDGHFIISVSRYFYSEYFENKLSSLPYISEDEKEIYFELRNKKLREVDKGLDLARMIDDIKESLTYSANVSPLMLDLDGSTARTCFFKRNDGSIDGIVFNQAFIDMLFEYMPKSLGGKRDPLKVRDSKSPALWSNDSFTVLLLPINCKSVDYLDLLDLMNTELNYHRRLKKAGIA